MTGGLYDGPSTRQRQRLAGLYESAKAPTAPRLSTAEWNAKDPAWRAAHPELAPPEDPNELSGLYTDEHSGAQAINPRDSAKDLRSFSGLGEYFNDPQVRSDLRALGQMAGVFSPGMTTVMGITGNLPDQRAAAAKEAVESMNRAGGVLNPELQGRNSDGFGAMDLSEGNASEGESPGLYSRGGKVTKEALIRGNPPGPDNVIIGAKVGERQVTPEQWKMLKPATRDDIEAVFKKTGAKGSGKPKK